jgi:hypothetical protein
MIVLLSLDRVTCRDWFQLSLKEGLTVFRDQVRIFAVVVTIFLINSQIYMIFFSFLFFFSFEHFKSTVYWNFLECQIVMIAWNFGLWSRFRC